MIRAKCRAKNEEWSRVTFPRSISKSKMLSRRMTHPTLALALALALEGSPVLEAETYVFLESISCLPVSKLFVFFLFFVFYRYNVEPPVGRPSLSEQTPEDNLPSIDLSESTIYLIYSRKHARNGVGQKNCHFLNVCIECFLVKRDVVLITVQYLVLQATGIKLYRSLSTTATVMHAACYCTTALQIEP